MKILMFFFLFTLSAFAADEAHELLARVVAKYNAASGITMKFTEQGDGESNRGTIALRGNDKFRLELEDRVIVCNGKSIWVYTPSKKRVTIDVYKSGKNSLSPEFFIAKVPSNATAQSSEPTVNCWSALSPPESDADAWGMIKKVVAHVDKETAVIHRVEITDMNAAVRVVTSGIVNLIRTFRIVRSNLLPPRGQVWNIDCNGIDRASSFGRAIYCDRRIYPRSDQFYCRTRARCSVRC